MFKYLREDRPRPSTGLGKIVYGVMFQTSIELLTYIISTMYSVAQVGNFRWNQFWCWGSCSYDS